MDPITLALILGGGGLLKSELVDQPREERDRKLAGATQRYSPWTGLKANPIREADPVGTAMQFGTTGLMLGNNAQALEQQKALQAAQVGWLNRGGSAVTSAAMNPYSGARQFNLGYGGNYGLPAYGS
jgi:hypothetical protein